MPGALKYLPLSLMIGVWPNPLKNPQGFWEALVADWTRFLQKYFLNYYTRTYPTEILIGLLALAGLLLLFSPAIILGLKGRRKKPIVIPTKFDSPKEALKAAKRAAKSGNNIRAGELYEQAGEFNKAVSMFLKNGAYARAANILAKKLNQPEKAVQLLQEKNQAEALAQLLESLERFGEAAEQYLKSGRTQTAAELFEKAGAFKSAAELYRRLSRFPEAARCYSKIQSWAPAAEMYTMSLKEFQQVLAGQPNSKETARLQELAKKAAYHWKQAGELKKAAEILLSVNLELLAAELLALSGEPRRAAEIYYNKNELKKAAELFLKAGDKKRAAELAAQVLISEGRKKEAARYLEMAEDYLAAADIYAGERNYPKAAQLYLKGGDSRTAAEMFIAAGQVEKAVQMFESQGDLEGAARLCEESGNYLVLAALHERRGRLYEAALLYQEHERPDKAVELFNKISPDHPRYAEACARLGELYLAKGEAQKAVEKLQAMAGRMPLALSNLDHFYLLGQAYEMTGQAMHALGIYQQLMAMNMHFKDVALRVNMLAQKIAAQGGVYAATVGGGGWGKSHSTIAHRYRILQELGRGGMGVVYLAEDLHLGRKVAFKVLSEELKTNPEMVENFVREARSLAQLNHQYIVAIFDAGQEGGVYYIIMEYVAGKNFKELLQGNRRLPVAAGVQAFKQLAEALAFAHELKVIHRDIKPANIMWTQTKIIKVMDFGLAKVMDQVREKRTVIAGTPFYMSPEQTIGRNVDHRSDIYSMGVTVYELLTGRVPFPDGDIGFHHLHTPPPPPRQFNPQIPPELEKIILKCMAKDPRQRYQSAQEVHDDLLRNFGPGRL